MEGGSIREGPECRAGYFFVENKADRREPFLQKTYPDDTELTQKPPKPPKKEKPDRKHKSQTARTGLTGNTREQSQGRFVKAGSGGAAPRL